MKNRKAILFLLSIISLLAYSRISAVNPAALPAARDIDGSMLADIPPVDHAITVFQNRIKQNPADAVSYSMLGELYMRQARETGDVAGYQRAQESLNKALELIPGYSPAGASLASAYYAQHDFEHALDLAQRVYESNPRNISALVIVADTQLALGNYQDAETIYNELLKENATPPVLARLAALEEAKGNPTDALDLISRAAGEALRSGGTRESVAWYVLRVGDVYFNMGEVKQAGNYYQASLRIFDHYHLALAGLGKVRAAEGKYDEAIAYYQQAINIIPQPDFLAALGDLYKITGQPDQAKVQYNTVEYIGKLAAINQQIYNRQLANFYSDHDLHVQDALRLALSELKSRKDIYGYDAAAWAEYKNGNFKEAQTFMENAMALGTQDARLYYHAGMIALELGDKIKAQEYLTRALEINPHFSILSAGQAKKTLQSLQLAQAK
ncbi:MAG: tetratricopeptide repeat protein [Chloroflexi bacterium]|nr:tetratricopeptide repeat protein [Chloroflexota bacterium]